MAYIFAYAKKIILYIYKIKITNKRHGSKLLVPLRPDLLIKPRHTL